MSGALTTFGNDLNLWTRDTPTGVVLTLPPVNDFCLYVTGDYMNENIDRVEYLGEKVERFYVMLYMAQNDQPSVDGSGKFTFWGSGFHEYYSYDRRFGGRVLEFILVDDKYAILGA